MIAVAFTKLAINRLEKWRGKFRKRRGKIIIKVVLTQEDRRRLIEFLQSDRNVAIIILAGRIEDVPSNSPFIRTPHGLSMTK